MGYGLRSVMERNDVSRGRIAQDVLCGSCELGDENDAQKERVESEGGGDTLNQARLSLKLLTTQRAIYVKHRRLHLE